MYDLMNFLRLRTDSMQYEISLSDIMLETQVPITMMLLWIINGGTEVSAKKN